MLEKDIKKKIIKALSDEFEIDQEKFKPEVALYEELGFDSLDAVDMVVVLEKTFGVRLSDESEIRAVRTVGDIFDLILKLHKDHEE